MKAFGKGMLFVAMNLIPASAFAAGYGTAGCGLGSIVMGNKPGMMQVLAATTNGTFASQTFGITTGTSNCDDKGAKGAAGDDDKEKKHKKKGDKDKKGGDDDKKSSMTTQEQTDFVAINMNSLKRDAAKGEGESLAELASTLGCDVKVYPKFTKQLQASHAQVFNSDKPATVLSNIKGQVRAQPALNDGCDVAPNDLAQAQ